MGDDRIIAFRTREQLRKYLGIFSPQFKGSRWKMEFLQPCPEPFNKMIDSAAAYGIKTLSIASYRDACSRGWAPAPTNDIQKAIWDKVHQLPTEPIKIKPETKKVER